MGEERERVCMCVPYLLIKIEIRTQYTLSLSFSLKTNLLTQSNNRKNKWKNLPLLPSSSNEISLVSKDLTKVSSVNFYEQK